uniref:Uncharacterized protein n=1 Tax=Anopheles culicifacies TaxID=139723 RepID=A0A182M561_9DIPT
MPHAKLRHPRMFNRKLRYVKAKKPKISPCVVPWFEYAVNRPRRRQVFSRGGPRNYRNAEYSPEMYRLLNALFLVLLGVFGVLFAMYMWFTVLNSPSVTGSDKKPAVIDEHDMPLYTQRSQRLSMIGVGQ